MSLKMSFGLVGAGLGRGGFQTTDELWPIKFSEARASSDSKQVQAAIDEEMQKLINYKQHLATYQANQTASRN